MSTAIRDEDEWDEDDWAVKWDGPVVVPPSPPSHTVVLFLWTPSHTVVLFLWTVLWLLLVYYTFKTVMRG